MATSSKKSSKTYEELKTECLKSGKLFEDPDFPGFGEKHYDPTNTECNHIWKRPREILKDSGLGPEFFVDGASRGDVKQGHLGDCWFLSALATICEHKRRFEKLVPPGQDFKEGSYAGIFRFNFWWFGEWTEVIIDDRLPTCELWNGQLAYLSSSVKNEFWSALLEKAYAKLWGGYKGLDGGWSNQAFDDFTGGLCQLFKFPLTSTTPSDLWQILLKSEEKRSLLCTSTAAAPDVKPKVVQTPNGLYYSHAHTITKVKEVTLMGTGGQKKSLVRIRNPHGVGSLEWSGPWNERSAEWNSVSQEEKKAIGLVIEEDGEFWMSYEDMLTSFEDLQMCNLGLESISAAVSSKKEKYWSVAQHKGSWIKGVSAGGCGNPPNADALYTNPQYQFEIVGEESDGGETVIIGLMQKERQSQKASTRSIGVVVYKLDESQRNVRPRKDFFSSQTPVYKPEILSASRQIVERLKLSKGLYCIIPTTFTYNDEADFLLRIYTEKPITSTEQNVKTGRKPSQASKKELKVKLDATPNKKRALPKAFDDGEINRQTSEAFKLIAGDDTEVDAWELQAILNSLFVHDFEFDGFNIETCKSILASKDTDHSGKLEYEECAALVEEIVTWAFLFLLNEDENGDIPSYLLRDLLEEIGITLSNETYHVLVQRYSHRNRKIRFDDFVHVATRLTTVLETFQNANDGSDQAVFNLDQFIASTIYS